jgi:hypothetical protein
MQVEARSSQTTTSLLASFEYMAVPLAQHQWALTELRMFTTRERCSGIYRARHPSGRHCEGEGDQEGMRHT